jgi:hypothetical protein
MMTSTRGKRTHHYNHHNAGRTNQQFTSSAQMSNNPNNKSTTPTATTSSNNRQNTSHHQQYPRDDKKRPPIVAKSPVQILGVPKIIKPPAQSQQLSLSTSKGSVDGAVVNNNNNNSSSSSNNNNGYTVMEQTSNLSASTMDSEYGRDLSASATVVYNVSTSNNTSAMAASVGSNGTASNQTTPKILLKRTENISTVPFSPKKSIIVSNRLIAPNVQNAVKFMNSNFEIAIDEVSKLLNIKSENEFYVIGVMGGRTTGKSTISNILAGDSLTQPFEVCGAHELVYCERKTRGIDFYMTRDRVFILDCEALFGDSTESEPEMISLQLGLFLYSICHILIFPHTEPYPDTQLIRYIRTLQDLKKGIPDQFNNMNPKIIFVSNNQQKDSKQMYPPSVLPSVSELNSCSIQYNPDLESMRLFRENVFKDVMRKFNGGEKDWLKVCAKNWESIRKNYFFGEYIRTLQRIYISS